MNVLLVGSGGREHALAWKLRQSPQLDHLLIAPGNPGTAALGHNVAIAVDDVPALVDLACDADIHLVVIGPETALEAGVADAMTAAGIGCFGPTRAAARIESSKSFSKQLMRSAGIPTADFRVFPDAAAARAFLRGEPWERWRVVKLDGLAAGKGVVVAESSEELDQAIGHLARSGMPLILEAPLAGEEVSLLALCDGQEAVPLLPAQDHKRLRDGDRGPNTGGMGAYAPVPWLDAPMIDSLRQRVFLPALQALAAEGTPFVGVLYAGLILTTDGPQVLEFNARFGDPEAQVILPLLDADLLELLVACVAQRLRPEPVQWQAGSALGVVLASAGYPEASTSGDPIVLPAGDALIFQAGTALVDDRLVTGGGRVMTVVGRGPTLPAAAAEAYRLAHEVHFSGKQMRSDIGRRGPVMEQNS